MNMNMTYYDTYKNVIQNSYAILNQYWYVLLSNIKSK